MKHFCLGAFQEFHISTERILRFSPYSSTFESFQLFFPLFPRILPFFSSSHLLYLLLFIHLRGSCAHFPIQRLLILLSHSVNLFSLYSRCAPCLCSPPNCSDCCFHVFASSVVCAIRLSVSNSSELPVLPQQNNVLRTEKNRMVGWGND